MVAASAVAAQRHTIVHRAANVAAASSVTAVAFIGVLTVRFAYPGEPRGGELLHAPRNGTLLNLPRTGTIIRG